MIFHRKGHRIDSRSVMQKLDAFLKQTILSPFVLTVVAIGAGFFWSWWSLVAIPFVWLGAFFSAANLNLVNGFLSNMSILVGIVLISFVRPLGIAITFGAFSGYYFSSLEKVFRGQSLANRGGSKDS